MTIYNNKYYSDGKLRSHPNRKDRELYDAIRVYHTPDDILVGMFQGDRGERRDLDFIVKILRPGVDEILETPKHVAWVADLLIKAQTEPDVVREIIEYFISFYDRVTPFNSIEQRKAYNLQTPNILQTKYNTIEFKGSLSISYIATIIELFSICEKRNSGAYMFKNMLEMFLEFLEGKADYMHLINAAVWKKS